MKRSMKLDFASPARNTTVVFIYIETYVTNVTDTFNYGIIIILSTGSQPVRRGLLI